MTFPHRPRPLGLTFYVSSCPSWCHVTNIIMSPTYHLIIPSVVISVSLLSYYFTYKIASIFRKNTRKFSPRPISVLETFFDQSRPFQNLPASHPYLGLGAFQLWVGSSFYYKYHYYSHLLCSSRICSVRSFRSPVVHPSFIYPARSFPPARSNFARSFTRSFVHLFFLGPIHRKKYARCRSFHYCFGRAGGRHTAKP